MKPFLTALAAVWVALGCEAATFVVTNAGSSGPGSLQQAILDANANSGLDAVDFSIGTGSQQIAAGLLPPVTSPLVIDGTTQEGALTYPPITLLGNATGDILVFEAGSDSSTVHALGLRDATDRAIRIESAGNITVTGCVVTNNVSGIEVLTSGNTIGGDAAKDRNVVSGNSAGISLFGDANRVAGNYVGVDATGGVAMPNLLAGIGGDGDNNVIESNVVSANQFGIYLLGGMNRVVGNYVGVDAGGGPLAGPVQTYGIYAFGAANAIGGTAAERNVVSGNDAGIFILGSGTTVTGNFIGTDPTGTTAIPNRNGVDVLTSSTVGPGNLISGNSEFGIWIAAGDVTVRGNLIGTNATGMAALGNGFSGIYVDYGQPIHAMIGGSLSSERNVISGNGHSGVTTLWLPSEIIGNYIGVGSDGTTAIPNAFQGILADVSTPDTGTLTTTIGRPDAPNVISGNGAFGVRLTGSAADRIGYAIVRANRIGVAADGATAAPNTAGGILIEHGDGHVIDANVIAHNSGPGVSVVLYGTHSSIRGNSIHTNAGLAIDLSPTTTPNGVTPNDSLDPDAGGNELQNYAVLSAASAGASQLIVSGTLNTTPSTTLTLDFYANAAADASGFGEAQRFLGSHSVITDAAGNATFTATLPPAAPGEFITATATNAQGSTSELSNAVVIAAVAAVPAASDAALLLLALFLALTTVRVLRG